MALANIVPVNVVSDWLEHENPAFTYAKYGDASKKDTQAALVKAALAWTLRCGAVLSDEEKRAWLSMLSRSRLRS